MRHRVKLWPYAAVVIMIAALCSAIFAQPRPRPLPPEFIKRRDAGGAFTLGQHYLRQSSAGSRKLAVKHFSEAERLFLELGDIANAAAARFGIGSVHAAAGDATVAARTYEQALARLRAAGDPNELALARLGFLYDHFVGKRLYFKYDDLTLERPRRGLDRQGNILDPRFSHIGERENVRYFNQPFTVYIEPLPESVLDDPRFAGSSDEPPRISFYKDVIAIWRRNGVRSMEIATSLSLMDAWTRLDARMAAFYGKRAVNQYQELRRELRRDKPYDPRAYQNLLTDRYRSLADLLIGLGRFAEADDVLRMLKEEEFFDFVERDAAEIVGLKHRVRLSEKERQLLDRYSQLATNAAEIGEEYRKLSDEKRRLENAGKGLAVAEAKRHRELALQVADVNAAFDLFLRKELVNEIGTYNRAFVRSDRDLQSAVGRWGPGTAAIYTVITEDRYRAILTTPTIQIDAKTEIPAAELNRTLYAFRAALQDPRVDPRPLGKKLYDILLKPLEKEIKAAGVTTLVWSLDGNLRYIPMAALSPDGEEYLVERFQNVTITPRTRERITSKTSAWKVLGMGTSVTQQITFPDQPRDPEWLVALPGTRQELVAIIRDETVDNETGFFAGRRFLDEQFTRKNLTASLATRKFPVVHLASHFRLGKTWASSYLVMGGAQLLSLEDIIESPDIDFSDVDLVTLSACNTALTTEANGSEVDSLAEAVSAKNGRAVLATLWNAYDESTVRLMTEFYRQRANDNSISKAAALRNAQLSLVNSTDLGHPFYWSAVTLIGNWR